MRQILKELHAGLNHAYNAVCIGILILPHTGQTIDHDRPGHRGPVAATLTHLCAGFVNKIESAACHLAAEICARVRKGGGIGIGAAPKTRCQQGVIALWW